MSISLVNGASRQNLGIESAPHLKAQLTTQKIMAIVLACLLPACAVHCYYFGFGVLWQFVNCALTAVVLEFVIAVLRHRKLLHYLSDLSYLVTAMILALTLPPFLPVYYSVLATAFAVIVCKAVFGGLGNNIFNPAMGGFIFVLISCPGIMGSSYVPPAPSAYTQATFAATFDVIYKNEDLQKLKNQVEALNLTDNSNDNEFSNSTDDLLSKLDALTGATYLENIKGARKTGKLNTLDGHDFSQSPYQAYLALALAYLAGGLVLMILRIILIKMVVVFFVSIIAISYILNHYFPGYFMPPLDSLIFGGTMIGAFFIITDPVTNAGTSKGRVCFSVLVAFLIVIIRAFGSYSDAVAFAVLLSNSAAPLIDQLTYRRPYGFKYKKGGLK